MTSNLSSPAIAVAHLNKKYGNFIAVHDLSLEVPASSLFAFLGANGAGKSTTIGCITTTLSPTSGSIVVAGTDTLRDPVRARRSIGAIFQSSLLDPLLTVDENLRVRAAFYGMTSRDASIRIGELSELVDLDDFRKRRYGQLSGGQKRRADIARALVHDPKVLFLDEPTAGLDPKSREQIWQAIDDLREDKGTTVFLTTHYMEETERADKVCIISRGRTVAEGTPAELRAKYSSSILTVRASRSERLAGECAALGLEFQPDGEAFSIPVDSALDARKVLSQLNVDDFEFRHGTMDDVFLAVTQEAK